MALSFSDSQIQEITGQIAAFPDLIASINADKANAVQKKQDYLDLDNTNKVYTDNFINILNQYHAEIKYLNAQDRTAYTETIIQNAGALAAGNLHFPTTPSVWVNFQPKLDNANQGLPIGTWPTLESPAITDINNSVALMKTGFTSGAISTTTASAFVVDKVDTTLGGFAVGHKVLFESGSNFLYGTVAAVAAPVGPGVQNLQISIIYASAGFSGILTGATVKNFHPGFTNTQREAASISPASQLAYRNALRTEVSSKVSAWQAILTPQQTALNANDAIGADASEITTAKTNVQTALTAITTWQAAPDNGTGVSKYGDTVLNPLSSASSNRVSQIPARAAQIITRIGSITQNPDGTYTGSGQYFSLFDSVNLRVNKALGTLRNYYQMDLIIKTFDQQIAVATATNDRDTAAFLVKKLTSNANGTNIVSVVDVAGLSIGNSVKIVSNALPVVNANITDIMGNNIELSVVIPNTYLVSDVARVVKAL